MGCWFTVHVYCIGYHKTGFDRQIFRAKVFRYNIYILLLSITEHWFLQTRNGTGKLLLILHLIRWILLIYYLRFLIFQPFIFQTIKCLLIVPNPESALNEEAGKLLLEQYEDYSSRAKLYTEIHAKPPK